MQTLWKYGSSSEVRNSSTSRSRYSTLKHIPKTLYKDTYSQDILPQGHLLSHVHCGFIHKSQKLEMKDNRDIPQPKNRCRKPGTFTQLFKEKKKKKTWKPSVVGQVRPSVSYPGNLASVFWAHYHVLGEVLGNSLELRNNPNPEFTQLCPKNQK